MTEGSSAPAAQAPGALQRLLRNRTAIASLLILAFMALVAIVVPIFCHAPRQIAGWSYNPEAVTKYSKHPPSWLTPAGQQLAQDQEDGGTVGQWQFPFGTDLNGRDLLSRVIQGAGISLLVGLCGALVSFFVGTSYGLIAGYIGGQVDNLMMRLVEILYSIPRLIIVIVAIFSFSPILQNWLNAGSLYSLFGSNWWVLSAVLALILWGVWHLGAKSAETTRARNLCLLTLLPAWLLSEALFSQSWVRALLTILLSAVLTWIFLQAARAGRRVAALVSFVAAFTVSFAIANHVSVGLAATSLKDFVGYNKIIILILCLGLIEWLSMARIVRGQVLTLKEQQFVLAARSLGQSHTTILLRHLLPNLVGVVVVYLTLTIPAVILDESFLSFLGLGINDPQASWGSLLSDGKNVINPIKSYWWLLAFPALAMSMTLLALNFLGDALRDALDPRAQR